ncbi:MAG: response regulator [Magnetococcales bacterium]|nr:response regulator [Magnetococcales bacterium]NGZ05392.1 response regulator [Magnetococcales bacterium]
MSKQTRAQGIKLRTWLLLVLLPLVTVPLMLVGWLARDYLSQTATRQAIGEVNNLLRLTQGDIGAQFASIKANTDLFSGGQLLADYFSSEDEENRYGILHLPLMNLFASYAASYPNYYEIRVLTPDGRENARFIQGNRATPLTRSWKAPCFECLLNHPKGVFLEPFFNPNNGEWAFLAAKKIFSRDVSQDPTQPETFRGFFAMTVRPTFITEDIEMTRIGKSGFLFVTDHQGKVIFSPSWANLSDSLPISLINQAIHSDNQERLTSTNQLAKPALLKGIALGESLYLMALLWEEEYDNTARPLGWMVAGITLVSILLVVMLIYVSVKRILLDPILHLTRAAQEVGTGALETRIDLGRMQELASLAQNFNTMVEDLNNSYYEIQRQNQKLMELDRMKDDFLANITHEFTTPLNGILGLGRALGDGAYGLFPEAFQKPLSQMIVSAERLLQLARQILNFAAQKQEQGKSRQIPVILKDFFDQLLARFEHTVQTKGIALQFHGDDGLTILADPTALDMVFMNLIGNAVKFTHAGGVHVRMVALDGFAVGIAVEDSGVGIDPAFHEKVFDRFQQGFASQNRTHEGAGLGLAIVKQYVSSLGGIIRLTSTPGVGTVFTVLLPLQEDVTQEMLEAFWQRREMLPVVPAVVPVSPSLPESTSAPVPLLSEIVGQEKESQLEAVILVVDDDAINREVIRANLSHFCQIIELENGQQCLELLQKGGVDLVLLDLMMPEISGYDVLADLQTRIDPQPPPVIVLSARDQTSAISSALRLGAVDYVIKPFQREELMARIRAQVTLRRNAAEILKQRLAAFQMEQKQLTAEAANRTKSAFLANMSHEIRSPMNAIIGMTDLILSGSLSREEEQSNLQIVSNAALSLLDLINDILDVSKIEAGHLTLEQIPFDLCGRMEDACTTLSIKAHQKGLDLFCHIAWDLPETLIGDPLRLKQILINLINNAIKFTHTGFVAVRIEQTESAPTDQQSIVLHVSVMDSGIGIPADKLDMIFDSFSQVDDSTSRQYGGTGLGLSICRHLVQMMNGKLWVESCVGQGSVFHFTVRLGIGERVQKDIPDHMIRNERAEKNGPPARLLADVRVLIGGGAVMGRENLCDMVAGFGAGFEVVGDPDEVLTRLDQAREVGQPFDALLLDEVLLRQEWPQAERMEGHAGYRGIVVLLPTNMGMHAVERHGWLQGALSLKKPVRRFQLLKCLNQILGRVPIASDSAPHNRAIKRRTDIMPMRILLVEDLISNQQLASSILRQAGHIVTIANHGGEAILLLEQQQYAFDVVLMDLQMPVMNGFEATERIRQSISSATVNPEIPVIAVTANALKSEEQRCLAIGMNGFLRKPYRPVELLQIIEPFTKPRKRGENAVVLKDVQVDAETLAHAKNVFMNEAPQIFESLQAAMAQKNTAQAIQMVEVLRKISNDIGANQIAIQAIKFKGRVEMADWDESRAFVVRLGQQIEQVLLLIR